MLHLFRRHRVACGHRSQTYRRCQCPIYVKGTLGGTYIKMALDQSSWEAATRLINQWADAGQVGQILDQSKTAADAVDAFLKDGVSRGLAKATIEKYTLLLERRLVPWSATNGYPLLSNLTLDAMSTFRATWAGGPLAKSKTQERLRSFFRWCIARGWLTQNPAAGLSNFRVQQVPTLPFSADEMDRILLACDRYPARGIYGDENPARMKAMILLLRWTGLRIRDAVTMDRQRVNASRIFLYTQKTGTPVNIPVPEVLVQALGQMPIGGRWYFWSGKGLPKSAVANWQRSLRALFLLAEIPHGHAHRFRDTFAVELLLQGVDISDVSILLGHSSIKITERHYAPWVQARQRRLETVVQRTWTVPAPVADEGVGTPVPPPMPESALRDRPQLRLVRT